MICVIKTYFSLTKFPIDMVVSKLNEFDKFLNFSCKLSEYLTNKKITFLMNHNIQHL